MSGNSVAIWFLLCLEIQHFDWLENWLGPLVLEEAWGVSIPGRSIYKHMQDRLDKSHSAGRRVTKN